MFWLLTFVMSPIQNEYNNVCGWREGDAMTVEMVIWSLTERGIGEGFDTVNVQSAQRYIVLLDVVGSALMWCSQ